MRRWTWTALAFVLLLGARPVSGAPAPMDLSPHDQLIVAQTLVGEAGWRSTADHDAIAWVLRRRLARLKARYPSLRMSNVAKTYSAVWKGDSPRKRWVRALRADGTQPEHWPAKKASWSKHRPLWLAVLARVARWSRGRVVDPCAAPALHWGGKMDSPTEAHGVKVDCGATLNIFYAGAR